MLRQKRKFEIALLVALCLVLPIVSIPLAAKGPAFFTRRDNDDQ
jgi:riboflavin transporter FmnP